MIIVFLSTFNIRNASFLILIKRKIQKTVIK